MLIYDEIFDALNLHSVPVVGTSFGGMMACDLPRTGRTDQQADPARFDLLWRDDTPVAPYMLMSPEKLVATLYKDLSSEPVKKALQMPEDPDEAATVVADLVWALGATGKFVWPIPDKGLKKRIHRIKAETLIVWGEDDALVSSMYAKEFAAADRELTGRDRQGLRPCPPGGAARNPQTAGGEFSRRVRRCRLGRADGVFKKVRMLQPGELDRRSRLRDAARRGPAPCRA